MVRATGWVLLAGGIALVLLDLFVFNEPKASLKAGPVKVAVQGGQSLGTVSIVGAVLAALGLVALVVGRRKPGA